MCASMTRALAALLAAVLALAPPAALAQSQGIPSPGSSISMPVSIANGGTGASTAPSSGQIVVGQSSTAYAPETVGGDCTISSSGSLTCTKTSGTAFAPSATTDATNASNITSGTLPCNPVPIDAACAVLTTGVGFGSSGDAFSISTPSGWTSFIINTVRVFNCTGSGPTISATVRTAASGGGSALATFSGAALPAAGSASLVNATLATSSYSAVSSVPTEYFNISSTGTAVCSVLISNRRVQ